jgi:hypothetical protein
VVANFKRQFWSDFMKQQANSQFFVRSGQFNQQTCLASGSDLLDFKAPLE